MTTMYVTYPGDAGTRFDRDYYVRHHLSLVMKCWSPFGLESCVAFWPADFSAGTIAIAECQFATRRLFTPRLPRPKRRTSWRMSLDSPMPSPRRVLQVRSNEETPPSPRLGSSLAFQAALAGN